MKPAELIEHVRAWQPVAYMAARGIVYVALTGLGAIGAWFGEDPAPDWLPRALAVAASVAGPLALVNLTRRPDGPRRG